KLLPLYPCSTDEPLSAEVSLCFGGALVARQNRSNSKPLKSLQKQPTGIPGFDEITCGGLPAGRPTLVCGSAGAGKTLFAMEFLVRGATLFNEPGVFISFEESDVELATNVASLGFDLNELIAEK